MTDIIAPDHPQSRLHRLFDRNFLDYTAYVIRERAIPDIDDGLKPIFRSNVHSQENNLRYNTEEQHGKDSVSSY
ncbi:MAG: hypothetical protein CDV28_11546 [Candidatus Electronema aureum]|uniref:Uncharacterized protein n=1 Tax=Candidatus Electronema aureum TaxID=2005002 RepID=A0A521G221_9BACT|nr:MAG: hypothetical protein CDV28_11546 [Candidatus Electronema aureum]